MTEQPIPPLKPMVPKAGTNSGPPLGWIPLLFLLLGVDESMKVSVIAWARFVPVALDVAQGIRDVPEPVRELGEACACGG